LSPCEGTIFLFFTPFRPVPGSTQPIQSVPGVLSPRVKWPGSEADYSPPTSAKVKNTWIYRSTPPYAFMATFPYHHYTRIMERMNATDSPHLHDLLLRPVCMPLPFPTSYHLYSRSLPFLHSSSVIGVDGGDVCNAWGTGVRLSLPLLVFIVSLTRV
jgi:hypothetical protein